MLHPSPLSSRAVLPLAAALARVCRVYALDAPGYGLSERLPRKPESLDDYLPILAAALDALGLARVTLYGAATGAQLAIEFAKRYPDRVELLVLDAAGHFPDEKCAAILPRYFPDVRPRPDGGHLATWWSMVRDLSTFFPWSDPRGETRIARDMPPLGVVQDLLLDYLRAGEHYDWAYRAAFYNERAERTREVRVPTLLVRWEGSVLLAATDDLIAAGMPENFTVLRFGPTAAERADGLVAAVGARLRGERVPDGVAAHARVDLVTPRPDSVMPRLAPVAPRSSADALTSRLVDSQGAQLHVRGRLEHDGRPLLVLHAQGESAALYESLLVACADTRPVLAIDLPGHGESDVPPEVRTFDVSTQARALGEVLRSLGIDEVDIVGRLYGTALAAELDASRIVDVRTSIAFDSIATALPDVPITPRWDGGHLFEAWYQVRDRWLWNPSFRRERTAMRPIEPVGDPEVLHRYTVELLKAGDRAAAFERAYRDHLSRQQEVGAVRARRVVACSRRELDNAGNLSTAERLPLSGDPRAWHAELGAYCRLTR